MSASKPPAISYLTEQLWRSNQVLVAILGICSALAVTNRLSVTAPLFSITQSDRSLAAELRGRNTSWCGTVGPIA